MAQLDSADVDQAEPEEPISSAWRQQSFQKMHGEWKAPPTSATSTRSPSPVMSSGSTTRYAASTTSWATSAEPAADCGFPNGEESGRGRRNGWDGETPPPLRPRTPANRLPRHLNDRRTRSPSRPSSLRNAMPAHDDVQDAALACTEDPGSDTEDSGCESGCETAGQSDEEDDNEWSGENGSLEALVISAVGADYSLAAFLIPLLHRDFNLALKSKIENWRCTTMARGGTDGSSAAQQSPTGDASPGQDRGSSSRKRRRTNSDEGPQEGSGDWDEGEDENGEDGNTGGKMHNSANTPADQGLLLACPFHKHDPLKYGVHGGDSGSAKKSKYRACTGPGFRLIQRLKEHLRRVHSPIQCERCKQMFNIGNGRDRAQCLTELAEHRKREESCMLRDASLKEGVDEAQWAKLDRQNRKRNQEIHKVEKWFEIWDVLFPGVKRPTTPWHEISAQFGGVPKDGEDYFADLFLSILDHKAKQGDIDLPDPNVFDHKLLKERLKSIVQTTFRTYVSMRENLSLESSSSGSLNRRSFPGAPSTMHRSSLGTAASHQGTAATAATSVTGPQQRTAAPPGAYGIDPSFGITMAMPAQASSQPEFIPPPPPMSTGPGLIPFEDPNGGFYYSNFMLPTQGSCQWIPGQFQPAPLPQNSALQGGQPWYFPES